MSQTAVGDVQSVFEVHDVPPDGTGASKPLESELLHEAERATKAMTMQASGLGLMVSSPGRTMADGVTASYGVDRGDLPPE